MTNKKRSKITIVLASSILFLLTLGSLIWVTQPSADSEPPIPPLPNGAPTEKPPVPPIPRLSGDVLDDGIVSTLDINSLIVHWKQLAGDYNLVDSPSEQKGYISILDLNQTLKYWQCLEQKGSSKCPYLDGKFKESEDEVPPVPALPSTVPGPSPTATNSISFKTGISVIYGDSQYIYDQTYAPTDQPNRDLANQIAAVKPDVIFSTGDMVDDGRKQNDWDRFNSINQEILPSAKYFPALGNHEKEFEIDTKVFERFPLLKDTPYYSVDFDECHYVILDSNLVSPLVNSDQKNAQVSWLIQDLSAHQSSKFTAILMHHPIYAEDNPQDPQGLRSTLEPIFKQYGVDIVFSGHDHFYQRLEKDGITYVVGGGGGAIGIWKTPDQNIAQYEKAYKHTFEFVKSKRDGSSINYSTIDEKGTLIDSFTISR
jgi:hypothetical protein